MKKIISLLLVLVMVLGLVACGNKAPAADAPAADAPAANAPAADAPAADAPASFEGRTLTLAHNDATNIDAIAAQIAAFEAKYNCKVEIEILAENSDEAESLLLTRAATGNLPDVFTASVGAKLQEFDPAANLYDMSGNAFVDRLTDDFIAACDGPNGEVYGVPLRTVNVAGVFYNKPAYEKLGLKVPTTWEELMANCQAIKDNSDADPVAGAYATAAGCQILFLSQYFYVKQENADFAQQYTNKEIALADSPAYMRGLEKLYEISEKGYINDDPLSMSFADSAVAVAEGTAVHTFARTNLLSQVMDLCPERAEDIGFFPLPDQAGNDLGVAVWLPTCWCISKNTENADMALALMDFLVSDEGLAAFANTVTMAGAFAVKGANLPENVPSAIREAQDWVGRSSTTVMEYDCDIKGANLPTFLAMVGTGDMTPADAIVEIEADNAIDAQQKGVAGW